MCRTPSFLAIFALLLGSLLPGDGFFSGPAVAQSTEEKAARSPQTPGRTGLVLPRFVSLRADEVNLRTGPGIRYPIDWVYQRSGLPVEIIDEFETWRRIRDWQGTEGWVHQSMVQGKRSILVTGKERLLRLEPDDGAPGVARVEAGAIGRLERCLDLWCLIEFQSFDGWLTREEFYGVYPDEPIQ